MNTSSRESSVPHSAEASREKTRDNEAARPPEIPRISLSHRRRPLVALIVHIVPRARTRPHNGAPRRFPSRCLRPADTRIKTVRARRPRALSSPSSLVSFASIGRPSPSRLSRRRVSRSTLIVIVGRRDRVSHRCAEVRTSVPFPRHPRRESVRSDKIVIDDTAAIFRLSPPSLRPVCLCTSGKSDVSPSYATRARESSKTEARPGIAGDLGRQCETIYRGKTCCRREK